MSVFQSIRAGMVLTSVFITACSTPHVVTLKDGREFTSTGRPDYDEDSGFYGFRTASGEEMEFNRDLIESIHSK